MLRHWEKGRLGIIQELKCLTLSLIKGGYKTKETEDVKKVNLFNSIIEEPKKVKENTGEADIITFQNAMKKVEKIRPANAKNGADWRFTFEVDGKVAVFQLQNKQIMYDKSAFEDLFKSHFGMYLPYELTRKPEKGETSPWKKFMRYIELDCEEIDPTESIEWIECDILLDRIAEFGRTTDGNLWIDKTRSKNALLEKTVGGKTYYLLKPEDVQQLIKDLKLATSIEVLGSVMNTRGLKRVGNPKVRVGNQTPRAWWFMKEDMDERNVGSNRLIPGTNSCTSVQNNEGY